MNLAALPSGVANSKFTVTFRPLLCREKSEVARLLLCLARHSCSEMCQVRSVGGSERRRMGLGIRRYAHVMLRRSIVVSSGHAALR